MKNISIGFLMSTCMFLMIGATDEVESMDWYVTGEVTVEDVEGNLVVKASENGRYQAWFSSGDDSGIPKQRMLDTKTGILYAFNTFHMGWHRESDETNIFAPPRK